MNKLNRNETEARAKKRSLELSKKNPNRYVVPQYCFGWMPSVLKRLNVQSAGDSAYNWYVFNGKVKQFTTKQIVANQNACIGRD